MAAVCLETAVPAALAALAAAAAVLVTLTAAATPNVQAIKFAVTGSAKLLKPMFLVGLIIMLLQIDVVVSSKFVVAQAGVVLHGLLLHSVVLILRVALVLAVVIAVAAAELLDLKLNKYLVDHVLAVVTAAMAVV